MTDILIRSCRVRVVRHGGWGWGAQPRALLDGLRAWLNSILSTELESALAGVPEGEITSPLRLRIPVTFAQLARWAEAADGGAGGSDPPPTAATDPLRMA